MRAVCSGTDGIGCCGWSDMAKPPEITAPTPLSTLRLTHSPTVSGRTWDSRPVPTTKRAVETALSQFRGTNEKTGCRPLQQLGTGDDGSEALLLVRNRTDAHGAVRRRLFREVRIMEPKSAPFWSLRKYSVLAPAGPKLRGRLSGPITPSDRRGLLAKSMRRQPAFGSACATLASMEPPAADPYS